MRVLIFLAVFCLSYYLGRFQSDWVYLISQQDPAADPNRLIGILATLAVAGLTVRALMEVAKLRKRFKARTVGQIQ